MQHFKWVLSGLIIVLTGTVAFPQQLKLGKNPSVVTKSAVLDLESDNQGLLFPRIADTALINANNPPNGMVIFHIPTLRLLLRSGGYWQPLTVSASLNNYWSVLGNAGTISGTNFIGTTDLRSLSMRTNNVQGFLLDSLGNVGIGVSPVFTTSPNREKLLVDAGTNATNAFINVVSGKGSTNNYLQMNIQNRSAGTAASSDVVASNDLGTESINYIDMGINSSGNASAGILGGASNGYLYSAGNDFIIGNATIGKPLRFFTTNAANSNEGFRMDSSGRVGIGTTIPQHKLHVQNGGTTLGAMADVVAAFSNTTGDLGIQLFSNTSAAGNIYFGRSGQSNRGLIKYMQNPTAASEYMAFSVAASERFRIDGIGNVGIGNSSPSNVLHVTSSANPLRLQGLQTGTSADQILTVDATGVVRQQTAASVASANAWSLLGNAGSNPATNFLGTTDAQDLVFKTNNTERLRIVNEVSPSTGTAGDIVIGDTTRGTIRTNKELVMREDGDQYGTSVLRLRNRMGENGAIFETVGASASLVDFLFKTGPVVAPIVSNIRFEARTGSPSIKVTGNTTEWQFGQPDAINGGPTLVIGAFGTGSNSALRIGNFGIGTISPTEKLDINGNLKFSGALMPGNTAGTSGFLLTSGGAGVAPTWSNPASLISSNAWSITGNTGINPATNYLGTTDVQPLIFKTSGAERMRLNADGNFGIGSSTFDAVNPEKFLLDAGATLSTNLIEARGSIDNYLQLNVRNQSGGVNASSNLAVTANNGTSTTNNVNIGMNSGAFANTGNPILNGINFGYLYSTGSDFLIGNATAAKPVRFFAGGLAAANERMRIDGSTGNVGIGNLAPAEKLDLTGNFRFSGALMPAGAAGAAGNVLTSGGAGAAPTWQDASAAVISTAWILGGNTLSAERTLGTVSAFDLPFITGNTEKMRIANTGNVKIGAASAFDVTNPEKLLIDVGTTGNFNVIAGKGTIDNYLQLNIQNKSATAAASSDIVATNNTGNESVNFIDMGINSSAYASTTNILSGPSNAYLYSTGNDLVIGNATVAKPMRFFTGGVVATNERMRIDGNGNIGIGTTSPTSLLHVNSLSPTTAGVVLAKFEGTQDEGSSNNYTSVQVINNSVTNSKTSLTLGGTTPSKQWHIGTDLFASNAKNFFLYDANAALNRLWIDGNGNTSLGSTSFDATNPEKLLVSAGTTKSVNAIVGKGTIDSYLQLNIQNQSRGVNASSDVVATADNGSETTNYIDMGINSSGNTSNVMGVANDAYLYNMGQDLLIGTGTAAKSLIFLTGGTSEAANQRMRITGTGNVGIGTATPNSTLAVNGSVTMKYRVIGGLSTSGSTTITATDYTLINTVGSGTWTLPAASTCPGRVYLLVNHGTAAITISPALRVSAAVPAAGATTNLPQTDGSNTFQIISDGTDWRKLN